jgi:AGZA family xanthine/uracil permease-like MFS transporter
MWPFIVVFLFMLTFDGIGTLIGVCEQAGLIVNNKLPRAKQAMISDAVGTVAGAAMGTSTVTSFIESAAGVEQGGRTGLTGLVVAALFLLALFFSPVVLMMGSYPPLTAPALVVVGAMMMRNAAKIEWADPAASIPAFLTLIGIPLSYSIADGLALGIIADTLVRLCAGRGREIGWLSCLLTILLLAYFVFIRARMP